MLKRIKEELGANFKEDANVLENIIERVTFVACDISNREKDDQRLIPYIEEAVKAEYLARGAEGLASKSEGSMSSSFKDIIKEMRTNIISNGVRRIK